jgi:transcriptional regulator with XRE-family HTH domain
VKNFDIPNFEDRLQSAILQAGGRKACAEKTGIPVKTLDRWTSGGSEPQMSKVVLIADASGLDLEWLARGKGDPFRESDGHNSIIVFDTQLSAGGGSVHERKRSIGQLTLPDAAAPYLANKTLSTYFVRGDSMDPIAPDGSLVILDTSEEGRVFSIDSIYAYLLDDLARLKTMIRRVNGITIRSTDPELYPDENLTKSEANDLIIMGRAVAVLKPI